MLRLVPTDVHAEQIDAPGPRPIVSLRRLIARSHPPQLQPARRAHRLVAIHALIDPSTRPDTLRPCAAELDALVPTAGLLDALDSAIGRLLHAGAQPLRIGLANTSRARITASLLPVYLTTLRAARLFDPRDLDSIDALDDDVDVSRSLDLSPSVLSLLARTHVARRNRGGVGVRIVLPDDGRAGVVLAPILDAWERQLADHPDAPDLVFAADAHRIAPSRQAIEAPSIAAEARAIAGIVADAVASHVPLDRIAVVIDETDPILPTAIDRAFHDAGVPSSGAAVGAVVQPEVQVILSLLDMAEGQLSRGVLIDVLRSPGLHPGAWVGDAAEQPAVVLAAALAHALRTVPISHDATGERFADALVGTPWMRAAVLRVADEVNRFRAANTRSSFGAALLRFIDTTRLGDPSARTLHDALRVQSARSIAPRADLGALDALSRGARAAAALRRIAEDFVHAGRVLPDPVTRVGELARELVRHLELAGVDSPGAAPRLGTVRISAAREAIERGLDLLIVAGLDANAYDAGTGPDAWLDDETLGALPPDARPRSAALSRAILNAELHAAVASAGRVVLTRALLDADGRERGGPHPLLRRAIDDGAVVSREPVSPLAAHATVLSSRQRVLARLTAGEAVPSDLVSRVAIERERMEFFRDAHRASGPFSGLVEGPSALAVAAAIGGRSAARGVAVTTAETAAACAFRVLAERVCGARPITDLVEADSALERGNLLHEALFLAFHTARDLPDALDPAAASAAIRGRLEAALLGGATGVLNVEARRMCIDDAMQVVDLARNTPDDLHFAMGEVKFGKPDDPLGVLRATSATGVDVWFEGKIDRVDLSADRRRARVIDYKSGRAPRGRAIGDTSFQLPLYALAVRQSLNVVETSAYYLSLRRGGDVETTPREARAQVLDGDALTVAATNAANAIVRVHSGELGPRPRTAGRCAWCTSRDICRRPAVSSSSSSDARTGP